jgi:putative ABC transport system substrate-binding protein
MLFAICVSAQAQQARVPRVGYLSNIDRDSDSVRAKEIRLALRERGYIEGQNIAIEYRYADGKSDRIPELAAELVRLRVDIIVVAGGGGPVLAAMNATKTIPIVMVGGGVDPVEAGFVESLARPGGNVTGVTNLNAQLGGKRLELLKEAAPKVFRVAFLYDPAAMATPASEQEIKSLPIVAHGLGLTLQSWEIRSENDFSNVFAAMGKQHSDALYVSGAGSVLRANGKRIAELALKRRLPSTYQTKEPVDRGGLMYYGADFAESHRRVAYFVDRILKGTKPADLPVEQPTKFELVINLKTAKQIGVTISPNVLARANRVIK